MPTTVDTDRQTNINEYVALEAVAQLINILRGKESDNPQTVAYYPAAIRDYHADECGIPLSTLMENLTVPLWREFWSDSDTPEGDDQWLAAEHRALRLSAEMLRDIAASPMPIGAYAGSGRGAAIQFCGGARSVGWRRENRGSRGIPLKDSEIIPYEAKS